MKNTIKLLAIIALITVIGFSFAACKESDTPKPHESTITAFGKTIKVRGDASISTADFNTAKGKLQEALNTIDADSNLPQTARTRLTNIMTRTITIIPGNAAPADVGGALTVGVGYLKLNDEDTITTALVVLVMNGAFAEG